jgi:hypothetical protein
VSSAKEPTTCTEDYNGKDGDVKSRNGYKMCSSRIAEVIHKVIWNMAAVAKKKSLGESTLWFRESFRQ